MSVADTPRPDPATRPAGSAVWAPHTTVDVVHPYYADPTRCRLRFEPSPEARDRLSRSGAVVRASANTWQMVASAALGPAVLDISVFAQDTEFSRCTEGLTVPLALHERSTRRFQLRGRSHHPGQADRLLVHHLPAANAVQFEFDTRGDPPALVSEIYVRR